MSDNQAFNNHNIDDEETSNRKNDQSCDRDPNYVHSSIQLKSLGSTNQMTNDDNIQNPDVNTEINLNQALQYLSLIDQLIVEQNVEMLEIVTGYETNNRYTIKNNVGQQIFFAKESTDFCLRNCLGAQRPFTIHMEDNFGVEVMQIIRPYKCNFLCHCVSCLECCKDEIEVQFPIGVTVGYVQQLYEGCFIRYSIKNQLKETVLKLHGPSYFYCYCPGDDVPFLLMSEDGINEVGKISKQWTNLFKEIYTDADNYCVQFPIDLDSRIKAVVLGSVFLIDFMYFENKRKEK